MPSSKSNLRGVAFMVLATGTFSINDVLLKLATEGLPPLQSLFMRGMAASVWCFLLVVVTGNVRTIRAAFSPVVMLRSVFELFSVMSFIFALSKMPIADITAIGQISPLMLLAGVSLVYREKLGWLRLVLMALGLVGALMVAQPSGSSTAGYAALGFLSAFCVALRDIVGRKVPAHLPGPVIAFSTVILVTVGAAITTFLFESWQAPALPQIGLTFSAGLFVTLGHLFIFLCYRGTSTGTVAPFYYMFSIWAVISGFTVFGTLPNALALAGIILVIVSGIAVVSLDERRRRLNVLA